jgi:transposase
VLGVQVWRTALGVDRATVIESIEFDEDAGSVVVHVRPKRSKKLRCGVCRKRAPGYHPGGGATELAGTRCRNAAVLPAG